MLNDFHYPLCLFGAGGHGKVVAALAARQWQAPICFGDGARAIGDQVFDLPVRFQSVQEITDHCVIVTIGANAVRETVQGQVVAKGLGVATLIADTACYMPTAQPGQGTMILSGAMVNVDAQLGAGVIVNTNAVVEHDCQIGDFCHIAPGAIVLGDSRLGARVWLGANATVLQGLRVAPDCVIGAGAVVTTDIDEPGVYIGCPARRVKT